MLRKVLYLLLVSVIFAGAFALTFAQEESKSPTKKEVVAFVKKAVLYAKKHGKEAALKEFMNKDGEFFDGELYIYAYGNSSTSKKGTVISHGAKPHIVGKMIWNLKDPGGVLLIQELDKQANSKSGSGWVEYMWAHPQKKKNWPKLGYVEIVKENNPEEDWWLGSGMYKTEENKAFWEIWK